MCLFTNAIHTYLYTYKSIWAEIPFSENCYNIFYTFLPHTNTYNVKYIATFIQKSSWDKMASRLKIVFVTGIDSESDFFPPKLSMYIHCAVCLIKIGFLFVGGKAFPIFFYPKKYFTQALCETKKNTTKFDLIFQPYLGIDNAKVIIKHNQQKTRGI